MLGPWMLYKRVCMCEQSEDERWVLPSRSVEHSWSLTSLGLTRCMGLLAFPYPTAVSSHLHLETASQFVFPQTVHPNHLECHSGHTP